MQLADLKDLTRIEQSLFGLPYIISGALFSLVSPEVRESFQSVTLLWIFPAFFLARISGMVFNQLIDRKIDALNPRTQNRVIPSGRMGVLQAQIIAWASLLGFIWVCFQINLFTSILSCCAAFLIYLYSYMKRVHASCHFVLGLIHFLGPVMAASAIQGKLCFPAIWLGFAALLVITGNDICYGIQDVIFDRENNLHSIPSKLGVEKSLKLAFFLHFLSSLFLVISGTSAHFPFMFFLIFPIVNFLLFRFHFFLRRLYQATGKISGIEREFFFNNVMVSLAVFIFVSLSFLWVVL